MHIRILEGRYAVARLAADAEVPEWVGGRFFSLTRTADELSLVVAEGRVPGQVEAEPGWCLLAVEGPLEFSQTGVLASLAGPLAEARISIFVLSTFETDYLMVKQEDLARAAVVLERSGQVLVDKRA